MKGDKGDSGLPGPQGPSVSHIQGSKEMGFEILSFNIEMYL